MIGRLILLVLVPLVAFESTLVLGNSNAAGSCAGGTAAVGDSHLTQPTKTDGPLDQTGMTINVGSNSYQPGATIPLTVGTAYTITLNKGTKQFKGHLLRVATTSGLTFTPNSANSQAASVCTSLGATGISHFNANLKDSADGTIKFSSATSVALDVTVVMQNSGGVSEYYYSAYTINVTGSSTCTKGAFRCFLCSVFGLFC